MPAQDHRLTTREMAEFVVDGFLRFDALVPQQINDPVIDELRDLQSVKMRQAIESMSMNPDALGQGKPAEIDHPESLTPLSQCYPEPSIIGEMLRLPQVHGIIESLVGHDPLFDHDFVHYIPAEHPNGQHLHVDAVIDDRHPSFDIQLFYYPTAVEAGAGGTRFVPGTHLRHTRAEGVARYQNILGEQQYSGSAGTVLIFHQALWHAGQPNPSLDERWMYKIRLNPRVPQVRLWNLDDFDDVHNDARDHTFAHLRNDSVAQTLRRMHPWQQGHELRYEQMERARLWRYLSNDDDFDVDYYHTYGRPRQSKRGPGCFMKRQQVLYLWLAEGALDTATVGWAFFDGAKSEAITLPDSQPPYATGLAALEDGWFMQQSPAPYVPQSGAEHGTSYLPNEFVFARTVEI